MHSRFLLAALAAAFCCSLTATSAQAQPDATVRMADEILRETMAIPGKAIPQSLLADAQGVAIIPDVIKIGFVAAVRRGHGVVMVRDANGGWTLPQFITLTGGSVGWQAGVQGTDVVLVFTTRKSVDGLLSGKFTIGADASAAAGPVGRNASASTDLRLKAEILSYSRSRGLFAGIALDGSNIEIDPAAYSSFYNVPAGQPPQAVPESAMRLVQTLTSLTNTRIEPPATQEPALVGAGPAASPTITPTRQQLAASITELSPLLDETWRKYLALPADIEGAKPQLEPWQAALTHYDWVAQSTKYENLVQRIEFQNAYRLLRDYVAALATSSGELSLPPPPRAAQ